MTKCWLLLAIAAFAFARPVPVQSLPEENSIKQRLSKSPNDPGLMNQLGESWIAQGRIDEAKTAFERAVALGPNRPESLENLALANLMLHMDLAAAQAATRLLHVDRSNYNGHLVLGITLLNHGDRRQAYSHFLTLHDSDPADPLVRAGMIEAQSGSQDERRNLSRVDVSPADALLALQIFHRSPLRYYVLPWLQNAYRSHPKNAGLPLPLAQEYIDAHLYLEARDILVRMSAQDTQKGLALLKLSLVEFKLHNSDRAQLLLAEAKNAIGNEPQMLLAFATTCLEQHRFVQARDALEGQTTGNRDGSKRHYLLGLAYVALGDPRAEDELATALSLDPGSIHVLVAMAAYKLKVADLESAFRHLSRAIQLDSGDAPAHYYLGQCYRRMNRFSDAAAELQNAARLAPFDGRAHAELGSVLMSEGRNTEAIAELRKALALDNTIASAHYRLGLLLRHSSATSEALEHLREASTLRQEEEVESLMELVPRS